MSPFYITHSFFFSLFNINIPLCNLSPILSLVGTTTCFLLSPRSEISISTLLFFHSIFFSFTPFYHSLSNNNQYSADCTTNVCVYVFTPLTSNSKSFIQFCISSFPLFAICIVNLCFLFTSNSSSSHRSSYTITISEPSSSSSHS